MIYDPQVEVTCDSKGCREFEMIDLEPVFHDYSGRNYSWKDDDETIGRELEKEGWIVKGEKHFCGMCAAAMEQEDDD